MTATTSSGRGTRQSGVREFAASVSTIMVKELRSRMRGRRAFMVLTLYLAVLALITYGAYVVVAPVARATAGQQGGFGFGVGQANASALIGQSIFSVLSVFQVVLVSMIAPAFTAGQISLEREKQTLDLLITTPLRPGAIIIGKLVTAIAFVFLMIVAAIPICAIVLMYGGASVEDIVRQQILLLAVAIGFGAIGIFASALMRRTQAATVVAYGTVLALTLGTAMVFAFWDQVASTNETGFPIADRQRAPEQLRYLNPMVGMLDIVSSVEAGGPTRFTRALYELFGQDLAGSGQDPGVPVPACDGFNCDDIGGVGPDGRPLVEVSGTSGYWWPRVTISFLVLAAVLTVASMRLVVPAGMRGAFRRRRARPEATGIGGHDVAALEGAPAIDELREADS
jgi:ABC-type transport system involved in multi-copper enzyme maturation permease subunit